MSLATPTITRPKALTNTICLAHSPSEWHTYTIHVSIVSMLKKNGTVSSLSSTLIEVDLTRDHSFHLNSSGQSMSWKEQVFLMFCTLSVNLLSLDMVGVDCSLSK